MRKRTNRKTLARLRSVTKEDKRKYGKTCKGMPGCTNNATKIFVSVRSTNYGTKRIMLCNECCDPRLLFSAANKRHAA